MATAHGVIKKTAIEDFANVRRNGIIAINLKKDDNLRWVKPSSGNDQVIIVTNQGQAIRFKESQLRQMGRSASGVGGIRLKKGDLIAGLDVIKDKGDGKLLIVTQNGFTKQTDLKEYKTQSRGGSGIKTAKVNAKTGPVVMCKIVSDEQEIIALSAKGQTIRTPLSDIRKSARATSGVRVMRLKEGDKIAAIICL